MLIGVIWSSSPLLFVYIFVCRSVSIQVFVGVGVGVGVGYSNKYIITLAWFALS